MKVVRAVNIFDARTMATHHIRDRDRCASRLEEEIFDAVSSTGVAAVKDGLVGTPVIEDTPTKDPTSSESATPDFLRITRMMQVGGCKGNTSPDDYDDKRYTKRRRKE